MPVTLDRGEAERLVHAYSDLILRLSYTYLKSTDDAQDICQTVFLKLLQKPQAFSSPEHEKAWIIRTAVNLCKDHLKSGWRRATVALDAAEAVPAPAEEEGSLLSAVNLLPLRFRNYGTQVRTSGGGAHGSSWFYDADPADNAIQFVEMMTQDQPLKPGTASVKFQDLSVYTDNDYRTSETLAEGTWRLKFDFSFEDSSISLPAGQSFTLNGMDATLDGVTLSPLSIQVDYTVHQELAWSEDRESGQINAHDREQSYRYFESLPVVITYTDGTTQDLTNAGGGITPGDGETVCQKSRIFDELRPLDEVASVTVGDIVLPVSAG